MTFEFRALRHGSKADWFDRTLVGALTASVGILLAGLISWQTPLSSQLQLAEGQVAPFDVVAPRQITYESQVLTNRARERAAQNIPDQYDSPDGRVRRQQIERAHEIIEFITVVRADEYATDSVKIDYLLAIQDLGLSPESSNQILELSDAEWQQMVDEIPVTLDRVMREEIRESNLGAIRRRVPALVMADMNERTTTLTVELVRALVVPEQPAQPSAHRRSTRARTQRSIGPK